MNPTTQRNLTIRSARPSDRQFVLELADRLVAFDVPPWRPKPELIDGDRRALEGWFLSVLAVTKDAEGDGVGSALLDQSVARARQCNSDRLTLGALVTNSRARSLYERKGFGGEYIRYVLPLQSG